MNRSRTSRAGVRDSNEAGDGNRASDETLARAAAVGDRQAAGLLIERCQPYVRRFLRRLTGCEATADDLAQETFVRMLRYADRYDARYSMRTWLLTIARRLWINHGRSTIRAKWQTKGGDVAAVAASQPGPGEQVAEAEARRDLVARLDQAIGQLRPAQREAVLLFHQQELSVEQAAQVMGVPANTLKSHLHRGRARLRRMLGELGEEA